MIQSLKFSTRFYILDFQNVFRLWHPTVFKSKYQMLVNLNRGISLGLFFSHKCVHTKTRAY